MFVIWPIFVIFAVPPNVYKPFNLTVSVSNGIVDVALTVTPVESNTAPAVETKPAVVKTEVTPDVWTIPVPLVLKEAIVPTWYNGLNKLVNELETL